MFDLKVTDIEHANGIATNWATHTLSIVEPGTTLPNGWPNHHIIHFRDTTSAGISDGPQIGHIINILQYSSSLRDQDRLLVHCYAGISRSPAAAIGILVHHDIAPTSAIKLVKLVRPKMHPNSLILSLFDEALGRCDIARASEAMGYRY